MVHQVTYVVPPHIQQGVLDGTLSIAGQIVRNIDSGKFVAHLKPVELVADVPQNSGVRGVGEKMVRSVGERGAALGKGAWSVVSRNPKLALGVAVVVTIGGGAAFLINRAKQPLAVEAAKQGVALEVQALADLKEAAGKFDSAAEDWVRAASRSELTDKEVSNLLDAWNAFDAELALLGADERAAKIKEMDFAHRIATYTKELLESNNVDHDFPADDSKVIDLGPYLEAQQRLFRESATG